MRHFLVVDLYNIFFRLVFAIRERNLELKSDLVLNSFFTMLKFLSNKMQPDHIVICAEGKNNWRKKVSEKYKLNRKEKMETRTPKEVLHDERMLEVLNEFLEFMRENTNVSILQHDGAEADDMIARFCYLHPNDKITICSVDNDFIQLINNKISLYNGTHHVLITTEGVIDLEDKQLRQRGASIDSKGKLTIKKEFLTESSELRDNWIEYALFCKCIRGDTSDNIFPAYPRAKAKSSNIKGVHKVGLDEAFEHRKDHGFEWINFMNQTWKDIDGKEHKVEDEYKKNQLLIDFNYIPDEYKKDFDSYIVSECKHKGVKMIQLRLQGFFTKHQLIRLQDHMSTFTSIFSREYC